MQGNKDVSPKKMRTFLDPHHMMMCLGQVALRGDHTLFLNELPGNFMFYILLFYKSL